MTEGQADKADTPPRRPVGGAVAALPPLYARKKESGGPVDGRMHRNHMRRIAGTLMRGVPTYKFNF
jgi:hypothetical protein